MRVDRNRSEQPDPVHPGRIGFHHRQSHSGLRIVKYSPDLLTSPRVYPLIDIDSILLFLRMFVPYRQPS